MRMVFPMAEEQEMITVLAGGVGAAKFLQGLVEVVDPHEVTRHRQYR